MLTNRQVLALAKDDPSFESYTSKLSKEIFTESGYTELKNKDYKLLGEFFDLSIRVVLQKIMRPDPNIPDLYKAIVEEYPNAEGGIFQRINIKSMKPINPRFKNLVNGGSVDPFVIRKPESEERFYRQNFDFQNLQTLQEYQLKKLFLSETGISDFVYGLMVNLDESYYVQKFEVIKEVLNAAINSSDFPLKDSQKIEVPKIDKNASSADQAEFLRVIKTIYTLMKTTVQSGKFNAKGYEHGLYPEEFTLLVRGDVWNTISTGLMATTYHIDKLNVNFNVVEVKDFGGITYQDSQGTDLLPVYDDFGTVKGFNTSGEGDPLPEDELVAIDPNEKIQAVLARKGIIFTSEQHPYETRAIINPAGLYTNFWASQPDDSINYDACYDLITFVEPTQTVSAPSETPSETP